ncbi:hypothetical protein ACHAWU_009862 [Discostella pseudostelligera]|uniref:Uncharacterized protein n=1 Tax=Discostella pseudostelligera TaxID=259834 RepID=A0ABD3LXJ3_9STRA
MVKDLGEDSLAVDMHDGRVLHSRDLSMMMKSKSRIKATSSSSSGCAVARSCACCAVFIFVATSPTTPTSNNIISWRTIMFVEAISSSDNGSGSFNTSSRSSVSTTNNNDDDDDNNAPFLVMSEILLDDASNANSNGSHATSAANNSDSNDIISSQASTTSENDKGVSSSSTASSEAVEAVVARDENGSVMGGAGAGRDVRQKIMDTSAVEGVGSGGGGGSDTEEEDEGDYNNPAGAEVANSAFPASASSLLRQSPLSSNANAAFTKSTKTISVSDSNVSPPTTSSQPLRTLKRLQAMLDDTDYATTTADKLWTSKDRAKYRRTRRTEQHQQRQHREQDEFEGQNSDARKFRHLERQRIIREEQERRKELVEQQQRRRQQQEQLQLQQRQRQQQQIQAQQQSQQQLKPQFDETAASDFTDDDTDDTDGYYGGGYGGSGGFELPNLPVYLSDGETDDFSEEMEGSDPSPPPLSSKFANPPGINAQQHNQQQQQQQHGFHQGMQPKMHPPPPGRMGQNSRGMSQPYYIHPEQQQAQNQVGQQSPTQYESSNGPYQNYRQQYPPYLQQQQNQALPQSSQQYQYGQNPRQQQVTMQDSHQQQYAAWAQAASAAAAAAANGFYYPLPPPPPHPTTAQTPFQLAQQHAMSQEQHQLSQAQQPHPQSSSYTQQYPGSISRSHQHQAASYVAAQHLQHLYQAQQQYGGGGGPTVLPLRPGGMFYPQPPPPPPQQASQESANIYQRHDNISEESPMSWPIQQPQQHYNSQFEDDDRWVGGEGGLDSSPNIATEQTSTISSPLSASEQNGGASTTATFTSTSKTMGVKSAFISPPPPSTMTPSGISSSSIRTGTATVAGLVESSMNTEGSQLDDDSEILIAGAGTKITFDSIHKLIFATMSMALLSYCAVSPRSLPFPEYNRLFLQNLSIVGIGAAIAPIVLFLGAFDGRYNNINSAIGTFHVSFTLGYALAFVSEIIVTTAVRLGVFKVWEPQIFSLTPKVPSIILPWVLREKHYKPKRITLFAADFGASCIASPIIEEYLKLRLVQWTCKLPRNFKLIKKVHKSSRRRKKQYSLQPVRSVDAQQVTNINCYVTQMLAASLGLKLFDATRRILMYTKETDENKLTYAICRGTFPIHELCGTMTALLLARRDVLGVNLPLWKILGPAVFLHGMANFRGMKPIFKWNSSTPWSEMQLNQLRQGSDPTWKQLLPKTYAKLVWLTILCRVFGFCMKNYYLIGRQAMKRTTTYSGKLHAFNAKLQTDAMLKRAKND